MNLDISRLNSSNNLGLFGALCLILKFRKIPGISTLLQLMVMVSRSSASKQHKHVQGVIHKPRGQIFGIFVPPPPSWSLLLNKAYVIKWSFG